MCAVAVGKEEGIKDDTLARGGQHFSLVSYVVPNCLGNGVAE